MSKEESIIEYIQLAKWWVNDSNTLLKVRVERPDSLYIGEDARLGGGNFLIALGLFSALSYLAKIYVLLTGQSQLSSAKEIETASELLKKHPEFKKYFYPKRRDSIDETRAFTKLMCDPECRQNLGIEAQDYGGVFAAVRHHLAHRILPGYGFSMITFAADEGKEQKYGEIRTTIDAGKDPIFVKEGERTKCFVDLLGRDVDRIADWLVKMVLRNNFTEENIELTYKWLKEELDEPTQQA